MADQQDNAPVVRTSGVGHRGYGDGDGMGLALLPGISLPGQNELAVAPGETGGLIESADLDQENDLVAWHIRKIKERQENVTAADELVFRHGGHVLIVEDNLMNQKVAKVVVKHCGMTADVANNGAEAVEIMKGGGLYDVILMDIQMPVMDGLEATQRIREMEAAGTIANGNYIVATSANATAENHREGYEAGMDEYITKPIYPSKLKELLAKPKRMQTVLELDDGADGDAEVTSLIGRNGSG